MAPGCQERAVTRNRRFKLYNNTWRPIGIFWNCSSHLTRKLISVCAADSSLLPCAPSFDFFMPALRTGCQRCQILPIICTLSSLRVKFHSPVIWDPQMHPTEHPLHCCCLQHHPEWRCLQIQGKDQICFMETTHKMLKTGKYAVASMFSEYQFVIVSY